MEGGESEGGISTMNPEMTSVLHVHSKFVESIVFCDLLMYSIVWFLNTETGKK